MGRRYRSHRFKGKKEEFAARAYKKCFKAYTLCSKLSAKTFVLKKYNDPGRQNLKQYQDTAKKCYKEEEQAKKAVQMHTLAKNIADNLGDKFLLKHMDNTLRTAPCNLES